MIKERVIQIVEYKGIPKEEFYVKIGMTSASFRGNAKKTPLNSNAIENILSEVPDVNPMWLLTGSGDMLNSEISNIPVAIKQPNASLDGIPLIPIEAMAGFGVGDVQVMEYECERYIIPAFREAEFLIQVKGSSMYPKYSSGDIVACKKLTLDTFFQWNKVYVLDTEQGALIKRIKKSDKEDHILLFSENPKYDPFDLHRSHINSIALVVGVIRLE